MLDVQASYTCRMRLAALTTALSSELQATNKNNIYMYISLDGSTATTEYATRAVENRKFTYATDVYLGHRWSTQLF